MILRDDIKRLKLQLGLIEEFKRRLGLVKRFTVRIRVKIEIRIKVNLCALYLISVYFHILRAIRRKLPECFCPS